MMKNYSKYTNSSLHLLRVSTGYEKSKNSKKVRILSREPKVQKKYEILLIVAKNWILFET